MSRLRPNTVKASLSNDEKKAIAAIAKRHEMSEAELIRFVLCNADDLDIDFGLAEIADQKSRTDDIHVRVSPEEKRKIESNADSLDMTVSARESALSRKSMSIGRRSTKSITSF